MDWGNRFGLSHNQLSSLLKMLDEINKSIIAITDKIKGGSSDTGLSAEGALVNQVPTADGSGNWSWQNQQGGSSEGVDADEVKTIVEQILIEQGLVIDPQDIADVKSNNGVSVDGTVLYTDEEGRVYTV